MSSFSSFQNELSVHGIDLHASELHGMLAGYLCAVKADSSEAQRSSLYREWLDVAAPEKLHTMLESACADILDNLGEYADFDFQLLVPDDESPISERARSIGLWCSGFLSGFGESGRTMATDTDAGEALQDLGRIAAMTDDVPDSEENEADLIEIEEFVRVSALLIFAETGPSSGAH